MTADARTATTAGGIDPDVLKQGLGVHAAECSCVPGNVKPAPHHSHSFACNEAPVIDGFPAARGIIKEGYLGILRAPPEQRPHALEIVFETPALAPMDAQVKATVAAVKRILAEYRELQAFAANL